MAAAALSVVGVTYGTTGTSTTAGRATAGRATGNCACLALMSNDKALKAMQGLRAEHWKDMQAWNAQYGSDHSSTEAQAALQRPRKEHESDTRGLFKKFGIKAPATRRFT